MDTNDPRAVAQRRQMLTDALRELETPEHERHLVRIQCIAGRVHFTHTGNGKTVSYPYPSGIAPVEIDQKTAEQSTPYRSFTMAQLQQMMKDALRALRLGPEDAGGVEVRIMDGHIYFHHSDSGRTVHHPLTSNVVIT